ncbi:MAG TPA: asparagine synthase (glutamine-hydrolyzing) [Candidatus Thermoplasmatota archaeon]|nr:asparagine synthase (glutamine-hydrolyzing) [Candidatus Thermoplasmatota archaeon]
MCGIAGYFGEGDRGTLATMARALSHRGPDGDGFFTEGRAGLAHRRLAIIDLSRAGRNPMFDEEGRLVLVHNGEIYNFQDLRPALEKAGHRFVSRTDTEVILHGHEEWGERALHRFNGMFAYALYDRQRKELLLARDRFGIKPLYYARRPDGTFLFASEVKALLAAGVERKIDPLALHQYLNLRYVPLDRTLFAGIRSVPPGSYVRVNARGHTVTRWWRPSYRPRPYTESAAVAILRRLLRAAVARHRIADVPVGFYLSGGLDSSTLVALAAQQSKEPLHTFSMGFGEPNDEFADARRVAEAFGTRHEERLVHASLLRDLPRMVWHLDAPRRNLYPFYLAQAAARSVTVVQNGLGGDELFGGYGFRYEFMEKHAARRRRLSAAARDAVARQAAALRTRLIAADPVEGYDRIRNARHDATIDDPAAAYSLIYNVDEVYDDEMLARMYGPRLRGRTQEEVLSVLRPYFTRRERPTTQVMRTDLELRMVYDFLPVDDATGMAFSLENRVPFLDAELAEFALTVPHALKWRDGEGKYLLRKAVAPWLPKETLAKPKQGFSPNVLSSYRDEVLPAALDLLPRGALVRDGYFDRSFVKRLLGIPLRPELSPHYLLAWKMLAFEVWHKIYFEQDDVVRPRLEGRHFFPGA